MSIYGDGLVGGAYSGRVDPYGAFYSDRLISVPNNDGDFSNVIDGFVAGQTLILRRIYTLNWDVWGYDILNPASGFNQDFVITAWLTVKDDPDAPDANAVFQKAVTTTNVAGIGQLYTTGVFSSMSTTSMRFDVTPADSKQFIPSQRYFYEIRYQSNTGKVYVPESGLMIARRGVSVAPN